MFLISAGSSRKRKCGGTSSEAFEGDCVDGAVDAIVRGRLRYLGRFEL